MADRDQERLQAGARLRAFVERQPRLANLLLLLATLIAIAAVAEIATRLFWHPDAHQESRHVGVVLAGTNRALEHEGIVYRTNSLGLRDGEVAARTAGGGARVLLLGDSFIWGDGVAAEQTMDVRLEERLRTVSPGADVLNGGIGGFNTTDELAQLQRLAPIYRPDLVLVFFFTNDVLRRAPGEDRTSFGGNWQYRAKEGLRRHSRFFQLSYAFYKDRLAGNAALSRALLDPDYFDLDDRKPGWVEVQRASLVMRDHCRARGISLAFVVIPSLVGLEGGYPFTELRSKLVTFLGASEIPALDLFPTFAGRRASDLWVSSANPHWNAGAIDMASDTVAAFIRERRLLASETSLAVGRVPPARRPARLSSVRR